MLYLLLDILPPRKTSSRGTGPKDVFLRLSWVHPRLLSLIPPVMRARAAEVFSTPSAADYMISTWKTLRVVIKPKSISVCASRISELRKQWKKHKPLVE